MKTWKTKNKNRQTIKKQMRDVMEFIKLKCCVKFKFMIDTDHHILIFAGTYEPQLIFDSYFNISESQLHLGWGLVWLYVFSIIPFILHTYNLRLNLGSYHFASRSEKHLLVDNIEFKDLFPQNVLFSLRSSITYIWAFGTLCQEYLGLHPCSATYFGILSKLIKLA